MIISKKTFLLLLTCFTFTISLANAQTAQQKANALAKLVANPVASLISVPFQNNFDFNYNSQGGYRYTLNFQPVIPASLGKNLNLINRLIIPFMNQNHVVGTEMQTGLSNSTYSGFFSPKKGSVIWGIGPIIGFPATNEFLGYEKFLAGPTAVILGQPGGWTLGLLANNLWAVAPDSANPNINNLYFQPFISYGFNGGLTLGVSSEDTYDWLHKRLASGMIALNMTQIIKIGGKLPASIQLTPKYFFASDQVSRPDWGVRVQLAFLFPK